ncbi:DUF3530 family protein [Shewanella sp. NIFS-20-20]|uniref:DUF3530 family protein n=1 Tax=Shewanella sp. NIFS-20-20 TaxID=2853806 RepID=UPI001C4866EE|nr:DUF3530 family protein [Shewanella sp. NIFS-20-20]MBV7316204.1 alpha/beta hydrolase family protein [Shewanella sp. NIFS-20-20]
MTGMMSTLTLPLRRFAALLLLSSFSPTCLPAYDYLTAEEVKSIEVEGAPKAVLVRPWQGKDQRGAIILLASPGTKADNPGLINHLRKAISHHGWASINVKALDSLPMQAHTTSGDAITQAGQSQLSLAPNHASPSWSEPQWTEAMAAREQHLSETLTQLDAIGSQYPGKRILLAMDHTAAIVINMLSEQRLPTPDMLVVINPYSPWPDANERLVEKMMALTVPLLDIQTHDGHPLSKQQAAARQSVKYQKPANSYRHYQLELLLNQTSTWQECVALVYGFSRSSLGD